MTSSLTWEMIAILRAPAAILDHIMVHRPASGYKETKYLLIGTPESPGSPVYPTHRRKRDLLVCPVII